MSILYILIGCSMLLAVFFLIAFIWSVKSGQLDDDYTPGVRILFDNIEPKSGMEQDSQSSRQAETLSGNIKHE